MLTMRIFAVVENGRGNRMDDLISRQAAIDALKRAEALTRAFGYHNVIETIRDLPSAQPVNIAKLQPNCNQGASNCASNCASHCASDCISRAAAIETVRKAQSIGQAHRMLAQLPSAQPVVISKSENTTECEDVVNRKELHRLFTPKQPGWIPVTERLPKPEDEVLLTMDYRGRRCVELGNIWSDGTVHTYVDEYLTPDGRKYRNVVAWCELPTPYREGGQG